MATFRKRFGQEFQSAFVHVLQVVRENHLSRFGTVSLDGAKIHANASRHSALSYGHAEKIEAHLKAAVQELLALAEAADQSSVADGDFEQCDNAQALVDTESMLILVPHVTQATNDKEQVEPMVEKMQTNPAGLNQPDTLLADTGYFSQKNVTACDTTRITPLIAVKRDGHHQAWRERFAESAPLAGDASPIDAMKPALKPRLAARPMRCASKPSNRCSASSRR